jgi:hypothetical protein
MHDGTFFNTIGYESDSVSGAAYLKGFAVHLYGNYEAHYDWRGPTTEAFKESVLDDGLRFVDGRLISTSQDVINEQTEFADVVRLIEAMQERGHIIRSHFEAGQSLYTSGSYHACVNEWRSFIESVLRAIWITTRDRRPEFASHSDSPPMKDLFLFLEKASFFTNDERLAYSSLWGFLSAGGHPGIAAKEEAHLSMFMALTFGHAALIKYMAWRDGRYVRFA